MQLNGPRAEARHNFTFAVFRETKVVPHKIRHPFRRTLGYSMLLLLALACFGESARAALSLSPSSASFGDVAVGTSRTISGTITNTASAPVILSGESLAASGFSISGLLIPYTL